MTKENLEELKRLASLLGINLNEKQIKQFEKYYEYLIEKNKVMNLTTITEPDEVIIKHFIDSLSIAQIYTFKKGENVVDVGSGAGFPGIPLKIAFPEINLVMVDSLNKRVNFLNEVAIRLGLENTEAIHLRAEEGAHIEGLRQNFDVCVSRAVANLATLSEYCLPYVKRGGNFFCYKAGSIEEELESGKKAISVLKGSIKGISKFKLPETDIERTIIKINVSDIIPEKYPRKNGLPSKDPIK